MSGPSSNRSDTLSGKLAGEISGPGWTGRSRGGYWGNWFFIQLMGLAGRRAAYSWLALVAGYYVLASPRAYRASVQYLARVLGPQPGWKWPLLVYRHFFAFGITLLDRLVVIMGRAQIQCRFEGEPRFKEFLDRGQGIILLGAHLGSWELGGHLLTHLGSPVNLVMLEREAARVRELFDRALQAKSFRLLTTDEHPLRSIPIVAALRRGEIVALLGDRSFGGSDLAAPFLGGTARFPLGPYRLAAATGAPIFQVFAVRERLGHYRCFTFPAKLLGRELLRAPPQALWPHVAEYAERLAAVARQYPFQWANFYPFWEEPHQGASAAPAGTPAVADNPSARPVHKPGTS